MTSRSESARALTQRIASLSADAALLFVVEASAAPSLRAACSAVLNSEERQRLARTSEGLPQDEFLLGRGLLRALLGAALGTDPKSVPIQLAVLGKPFVSGCEFNLTHASGRIVVVLTAAHPVGVDIERIDNSVEALDIAQDNFTPHELACLRAAPTREDLGRLFYRIWTRKEAILKAHGGGLTLPLTSLDVATDLTPHITVELTDLEGRKQFFHVQDLELGDAYMGALASPTPLRLEVCTPTTADWLQLLSSSRG